MSDEPTKSPMGWYYRMSPGDYPDVYRCKIGTAWERMDVCDLGDFTPDELRFIAGLLEAAKLKNATDFVMIGQLRP